MRQLQSQMDDVFAQTFRGFGNSFGQTGFASSVDLREQKDKYVARIYLPNGDTSQVNAKIDGGNLDITMNGTETKNGASAPANFKQVITLPEPIRGDQMQISRKPNMVVITIPKANPTTVAQNSTAATSNSPTNTASSSAVPGEDWDHQMIDEMKQMEARMDRVFHDAFPNDMLSNSNALELGSTVNVDNEKDKYVVHFALPDRDLSNVKVNFANGQLDLTAQEEKNDSSNTGRSVERGRYEESITLPGPVKDSEMKIDRQASAVIVTLPKA